MFLTSFLSCYLFKSDPIREVWELSSILLIVEDSTQKHPPQRALMVLYKGISIKDII